MMGGASATQPVGRFIMFATGSPNTAGASDGPFSPRKTVTFAPMNSPQGSVTNVAAISGCTATAIATALGWNLYDAAVGGNRLLFGTMTAALGCASADVAGFNAGALKITLF
jgi:hypothetical protein